MKKSMIISMSFDAQPEFQCTPLGDNEPGLGLGLNGITWFEQSDALLYTDSHNELMIQKIGRQQIEIERNGRRCFLQSTHKMRVLKGDIIRIGGQNPHTFEIRRMYCTCSDSTRFHRMSKMAMLACAAAMVMSFAAACSQTPAPNHAGQEQDTTQSSTLSPVSYEEVEEVDEDVLVIPYLNRGILPAEMPSELDLLMPKQDPDVYERLKESAQQD